MDGIDRLVGQRVVVVANGITYTGRLVEISEAEVNIEGENGWIVIPVDQVAEIREAE